MGKRGSLLVRVTCWYCAHSWLTRLSKGMTRCPSCRTFNHLPGQAKARGVS